MNPAVGEFHARGLRWTDLWIGLSFLLGGLLLNELPWYYSVGKWADLLLPIAAFFLAATGIVWFLFGLVHHANRWELGGERPFPSADFIPVALSREPHRIFFRVSIISIPLTVLFGVFYLGIQFVQTGADRFGECPGLASAAAASNVIPESLVSPPRPAVGCGSERYGMFLTLYNSMAIYGVTDSAAQERVLRSLSEYHERMRTRPIRVAFYEKENWAAWHGKNGASGGQRGPEKRIRVAVLH